MPALGGPTQSMCWINTRGPCFTGRFDILRIAVKEHLLLVRAPGNDILAGRALNLPSGMEERHTRLTRLTAPELKKVLVVTAERGRLQPYQGEIGDD